MQHPETTRSEDDRTTERTRQNDAFELIEALADAEPANVEWLFSRHVDFLGDRQ